MDYCGSPDCYSENTMYHDFDINFTDLIPWNYLLYFGALVYTYFSFGYSNHYLNDEIDDDESYCEYDRSMWPYLSNLKVPYDMEERMRFWEKNSQQITKVESNYPFIVRIDGCSFSSFTKQLKKFSNDGVFSDEFRKAMLNTACDLLVKFRPSTVYTHSDEITLVFKDYVNYDEDGNEVLTGEHYRNGKVYKLLSEIPSIGSTAFTRNINSQYANNPDALKYLSKSDLAFDGRLLVFPHESEYEIANHMIWRTRDCYRNYISAYAEKHIGKSKLDGVSTEERVRLLKEKGIDLEDKTNLRREQLGMKYGTFLKLHQTDKNAHTIQAFYSNNLIFSDELIDFMLEPMKDLEYNVDAENESDIKLETKPSSFALDSYEFEDVFSGTFTLKKSKRDTHEGLTSNK